MTKSSRFLLVASLAAAFTPSAHAGLTFSQDSGVTSTAFSGATIQTVADPTTETTVNQAMPGSVLAQTFTVTSTLTLGSIKMVGDGGSVNVGVHLFEFAASNSGYDPATSGGYVPATATTGVDLLGGGSGLGFQYNGASSARTFTFAFTGTDAITLNPGVYAFELWNLNASGDALNLNRGGESYAGGSFFAASSTALSTSRNNVAGGTRDSAFAVYAATPTPEPGSVAALGLGALALVRRRRR